MRARRNLWLLLAVAVGGASLWAGARRGGGTVPAAAPPIGAAHVRVVNGAGRDGLAHRVALALGPAGCVVAGVGNAPPGPWPRSLLVDRRLGASRAASLSARLGGLPVLREWDARGDEDAVLVLGEDWRRVLDALVPEAAAK